MLQPEKIHIEDVKIIRGQIESPFEFDVDLIEGHDFNVGLDIGFDLENVMAKVDFIVDIRTKSENATEASGSFYFVFLFQVENLEDLVTSTDSTQEDETPQITMDGDLGNALSAITYSTVRGILLTRFQGTLLENFILPVISPDKLLKQ